MSGSLALPGTSLPVITNVQAGSWLIALVWTVFTSAMSSTCFAVCGSSSLTHMPHWPCCANFNMLGATGNRAWPLVIVVSRWPLRTDSGRSLSYQSASFGL